MKLLIPVLLAALTQPGPDPQKLFRAMEEKITNASSVQITVAAKLESKKGNPALKGTLFFAPKGKHRVELTFDVDDKKSKMLVVSDGTQMSTRTDEKDGKVTPTPEFVANAMLVMAAKTGIMSGMLFGVSRSSSNGKDEKDPFAGLKVSDFKLGKVEKVGDKDAQIIEYQLTMPSPQMKVDAAVWIDVKTTLPVKRRLVLNMGGERMTLTENYSEFRLDARLDAKVFDLPK